MNSESFKNYFLATIAASATVVTIVSCSKTATDEGSGSERLSAFATVIAQELTVGSPTSISTARTAAFHTTTTSDGVTAFGMPEGDANPDKKSEAIVALLSEPATCAITINLAMSGRANCYGPSVNYTNHEFNSTGGSWPGGDLGLWESTEPASGEACVAAQLTSQMKGAVAFIDLGQYIAAGMACVAAKSGSVPPAVSSSLDLTSSMAGIVTVNGSPITVSSALIARSANDGSGNPVYVTTLSGTSGTKTFTIRLKHVPTNTDDTTNKGKISVTVSDSGGGGTNAASLEYDKSSATAAKILLKTVNSNAVGADLYESGTNKSVKISTGWNNNANYFLGNLDLTAKTGKFAYAWQAGSGDDHTRVFNLILNADGTGTGFFGFGPTMSAGPGAISGRICAWTGPDQTHVDVPKVQRQNITKSAGKFMLSGTSLTVFDPVADCDATGAMSMNWTTSSGQSPRTAASTTENLAPIADVTSVIGTLPTAPANVDL